MDGWVRCVRRRAGFTTVALRNPRAKIFYCVPRTYVWDFKALNSALAIFLQYNPS